MLLENRIVRVPYYDIVEEQITEDVTNNENPGEILPTTTKMTQLQKMHYILDSNIYAKEDMILVCRVESLDSAQQLLDEYILTVGFEKNIVSSYVYGHSPAIMQQLLMCLYYYWPTIQSQITSVRIGGKTSKIMCQSKNRLMPSFCLFLYLQHQPLYLTHVIVQTS